MKYVEKRTDGPAERRPATVPTASLAPRLLPWPSPSGNPSYLVTDNGGSHLSRLADDLEEAQVAVGSAVLRLARAVLDDPASPYTEVRYAGVRLAECLADALRVAESRGMRLPAADVEHGSPEAAPDDEQPTGYAPGTG